MTRFVKEIFSVIIISVTYLYPSVVKTEYGLIEGLENSGVHEFLGIPFAAPPVGVLRWRSPVAPTPWMDTLQVKTFRERCIQKDFGAGDDTNATVIGSEDCLYLNVWTPLTDSSVELPVLVFIHGGGNQQGNANDSGLATAIYHGRNLSKRGNAVVVTIQYRLGALGFLVHKGLEGVDGRTLSGNYGVLDQIMALNWVKRNIRKFGGDTSKVMLFGESAGGLNTGNLMISPLAAGLFSRACIESAIPQVALYDSGLVKSKLFVDSILPGFPDNEKISRLRAMPADSIIMMEKDNVVGGVIQGNWKPVVDGAVFLDQPLNAFASGSFNKMPLIIGSNSDEMSIGVPKTVTPLMVTTLIRTKIPEPYQSRVSELYPAGTTNEEAMRSYIQILTDGQFTSTVRRTARAVADNQEEPVFRYFFTHTQNQLLFKKFGAYHGLELFYVFNNYENSPLSSGSGFTAADDSVQRFMLTYWVNFARDGNPNGSGFAYWPEFESASDCYMEIRNPLNDTQCGIRTEKCDLWDSVYAYMTKTTEADKKGETRSDVLISGVSPNPFNPDVIISLNVNKSISDIKIYDLNGRQVKDLTSEIKKGFIRWDGSRFASGTYILKAASNDQREVLKLMLLK